MQQLQVLLQKVLDAVVVMRCDGTVADWNGCAEVTFGWTREEAIGRSMSELIVPPQHRDSHANAIKRYLATGEAHVLDRRIEISGIDRSGREFPVELTITEADYGGERVFIGFLRDISDRKRAELALRDSEARLEATYNHAFVGIAEVDREGRFLRANEQYLRITGYGAAELPEHTIFSITDPEDMGPDRENFERQWSGEIDRYTVEKRYVRKDGQLVWVEVAASIVRGGNGLRSYAVRIVRDITQRKADEQHQRLLLTELNHRVKNTLTVVQSLALQTFGGAASQPEELRTFEGRLAALSTAHDLLVKQHWTPTPLRSVIERSLCAFDMPNRFEASGDEVLLDPQAAVTFSLALHELATNATKHGALSTPEGRVRIAWSCGDDGLRFHWHERGGPQVTEPARNGFGTRLLRHGLARELGGDVRLDYEPQGLKCTIVAPDPQAHCGGTRTRT